MNSLSQALLPVRRRMRVRRTFIWSAIGLFGGAICVLLLRAASFLWAFSDVTLWSLCALVGVPFLCALISWLWPITDADAARQADALGLKARAQTALMLKDSHTPMAELQRQDTLKCLYTLKPKALMPMRAPRFALIGLAACAVLFGLTFLITNPQTALLQARAAFQAEMKKQADLVDTGAAQLDAEDKQTPELRKLLGDLARELRLSSDPKTALSALSEAERKLTELTQTTGKDTLKALNANGLGELAKALEAQDMVSAEQLLGQQSTAQALGIAAQTAASQTASQALSQAAKALQSGNIAQALQSLQSAALGQSGAAMQAAALGTMARNAAVQAGAAQSAGMQAAGLNASSLAGMTSAGGQGGTGRQSGSLGLASVGGAGLGTSSKDGGYREAGVRVRVQGSQGPRLRVSEYESIYDPTRIGGDSEATNERGQLAEGDISEATVGMGVGSIDQSVPYNRVLPEYQLSAVEAAQNADLPEYAQKWVERYFNALAE